MPEWLIAAREWVQASDPGLSRLHMAASAAAAMATALGVEFGFASLMQAGREDRLIAMLLGALVAMLGSIGLTAAGGAARTKALTALLFPLAIGAGLILGVAVGGRTDLMLGVFVIVMFVAVFLRRFGPAFFFLGFLFWLGYFFASFLGAKLAMMPFFMEAVAIGSAWVLVLSLSAFRVNPARTLRRTVAAFDARARGVARGCAELLQSSEPRNSRPQRRLRRHLRGQERRLAEAALMVEGWASEPTALPRGQSAAALRRQLIGAQQALDALVATTEGLSETGGEFRAAAGRIARRLANRDDAGAARRASALQRSSRPRQGGPRKRTGDEWSRRLAHRFAKASLVFVSLARAARRPGPDDEQAEDREAEAFEPTAGLVMGNLPGSPAVAQGLSARGASWNPLARLDLVSRQAIQVAVAGGLAILAGRALSPTRYYWAVIAAFIMFSGTATRSETFLKGFNRVIGTALGLAAAVALAELTADHPIEIVITIVASMFCGFYLLRVNYAYMIFFVTIMVAQLYTIFHEFTPGLLLVRLEETAIGAGVGFAVALFLMPLSTRDTVRSARREVLEALATLLNAAAERLEASLDSPGADGEVQTREGGERPPGLYALSRTLDDRMRRFALVTQPLTRPLLGGGNFAAARQRLSRYVATATSARELVVAVNDLGSTALDRRLIAVPRALAAAASRLADVGPRRAGAGLADPLREAEATLTEFDSETTTHYETERVIESLRRLRYLLHSLGAAP